MYKSERWAMLQEDKSRDHALHSEAEEEAEAEEIWTDGDPGVMRGLTVATSAADSRGERHEPCRTSVCGRSSTGNLMTAEEQGENEGGTETARLSATEGRQESVGEGVDDDSTDVEANRCVEGGVEEEEEEGKKEEAKNVVQATEEEHTSAPLASAASCKDITHMSPQSFSSSSCPPKSTSTSPRFEVGSPSRCTAMW
jgi:hypothetical protein